jgi:hypothetical protein
MQLLCQTVAGLAVGEDFANVVDRSLYLVDMPGLILLHYQGSADDLGGGCNIHEEGLTGLRRGQDRRLGDERFEVVKHPLRLIRPVEGI